MNAHLSLPLPVARAALPSLVFHHALVTSIAGCPGCTAFPSLVFHHARRQSTDEYSTGNSTVCLVITEHVTPSLTVRPNPWSDRVMERSDREMDFVSDDGVVSDGAEVV
jgi:hypothetical protein